MKNLGNMQNMPQGRYMGNYRPDFQQLQYSPQTMKTLQMQHPGFYQGFQNRMQYPPRNYGIPQQMGFN